MEKCRAKDRLYNITTKRCYKSCEQKKKDTHPVTKKCRQRCKGDKTRRVEDFRCVKTTRKIREKYLKKKIPTPKAATPKAATPKAATPKAATPKAATPKAATPKAATPKANKEEIVPPPLQKELTKNFKFIDNLLRKGEGKNVSYNGSVRISEYITVYFHEKYKQHCPMYPIKTYSQFDTDYFRKIYKKNKVRFTEAQFKEYALKNYKADFIEWNKDKFLKNLKLCLDSGEELIMIPMRIPSHLNMIIFKVPTREIIRFEPHGPTYNGQDKTIDKDTNTFLEKLTNDINVYLKLADNRKFTYKNPTKICPNYNANLSSYSFPGFQSMEVRSTRHARGEGGGFCQLWSWFFAECVIQNPEMDVKEVYKEAFDALKNNENNFATIIRGYFISINEELLKMKKVFSIKRGKFTDEKASKNDILLDYLLKSNTHLKTKPQKVFQDGGKKHKFILPEANPKAAPVKF
jgi:hypothetical protein